MKETNRGIYLSIAEAADVLNIHPNSVRNLIARGKLAASRIGGTKVIRISRNDIEGLLIPVVPQDIYS